MALNAQQRQGLKVLVVEDEAPMAELVKTVLNSLGVSDVTVAEDGQAALKIVKDGKQPFDLVVSDWMMPKMNGLELLEIFRADYPGTPFVMLTAKTDVEAFNAAKRTGATYFFMKPIETEDLKARLDSLFQLMD